VVVKAAGRETDWARGHSDPFPLVSPHPCSTALTRTPDSVRWAPERINGGQALIRSLELEGTDTIFGLPGGAILPVYDPILDSPIRHILVRHEQGAGHMAEGYAHATGRPGVAMVTSGPAATNIVTPLADAYMDSVPMVCITGQVATASLGTDAFQEADTVGITQSVTKHNELVTEAADIPLKVRQAFHSPPPAARARCCRHPQGHRRPEQPRRLDGVGTGPPTRRCGLPARLPADHDGHPRKIARPPS
jgi:hypothetical protein